MKNNRILVSRIARTLLIPTVAFSLSTSVTYATDVLKADNATALNASGSWVGNTIPTSSDIAVFGSTITATHNPALGANTTWDGIKLNGALGIQIIADTPGATLTLGASGIDFTGAVSGTTATTGSELTIQPQILLSASQTWNVTNTLNANTIGTGGQGDDLFFGAAAQGTTLNLGTNTVTIQGGGTVGIGSGYSVSAGGTFNVTAGQLFLSSNSNRSTISSASVIVGTGATFKLMGNSALLTGNAVEQAGSVTLNAGTLAFGNNNTTRPSVVSGNISVTGTSAIRTQNTNSGSSGAGAINTISGNISGSGTLTIDTSQSAAQTFTISGVISDNGGVLGITKTGGQSVIFSNANTYTGTTFFSSGTIFAGTNTSFGTGILDFNTTGGTIASTDSTPRTFTNALSLSTTGTFGTATTGNLKFTGGNALGNNAGGAKTMIVNNALTEFSGAFTSTDSTGSLTKNGPGIMLLSGNSTYQKATIVNAGTLLVTGSLLNSQITVNSGGTFGGTGSVTTTNKSFTLLSGGKLDPGTNGSIGLTINTGTNTFDISAGVSGANTGALLFNLDGVSSSDKISLSLGTLNIGSELDFNDFSFTTSAGFGPGTYTLFDLNDSSATLSGSLALTGLDGTVGGLGATLAVSGNDVVLQVVPEPGAAISLLAGLAVLSLRPRRRWLA